MLNREAWIKNGVQKRLLLLLLRVRPACWVGFRQSTYSVRMHEFLLHANQNSVVVVQSQCTSAVQPKLQLLNFQTHHDVSMVARCCASTGARAPCAWLRTCQPEPPCLPASTGQTCAYVSEQLSSRGRPRRCASRVGAGWRTCLKHTCADPGCGEPKPSSTQFCPRHGAANASRPHDGAVQHRPGPDLGTRASAAAAPATRSAAAAGAHGGAGPPAKPARVAPRVPDNGPGPECFLYDNVREALPGARPRLLAGPVWRREWCGAPTAKATPPSPPLFDPLIFTAVTFERPYEVEA